jgi:hypothetical protein
MSVTAMHETCVIGRRPSVGRHVTLDVLPSNSFSRTLMALVIVVKASYLHVSQSIMQTDVGVVVQTVTDYTRSLVVDSWF